MNKLVLINNEKVSKKENQFYCENIDMKSIPEGLSKNFETHTIVRKSKADQPLQMIVKKVSAASNIFTFLYYIFKTFKHKTTNYLLISITPYTFAAFLLLVIFRKKIFVYLRSNGYEEYRAIIGPFGSLIFHLMYTLVTYKSHIITCQHRLVQNNDYDLVFPSELDDNWLKNLSKSLLDKPRLLYVGRIKIEKGIFSLTRIFDEITSNAELSVVGKTNSLKTKNKKINFLGFKNKISDLIKIYDNHNIIILPSFTEAHPKVVDESLARARPVIIFEEISHIIKNRHGIFVSKRDTESLSAIIHFIMNNYLNIQKEIKKNRLPTKQKFISQITQILS